ncbi:undecaprenyl-diphosphatase [Rhodoferax sediminis]|jgi:undecaprenyl-diphosphatase|uniref:Undecaprenyl-diphosphatase n=1 Tax=Rhodoferax sediminis TaxID=2509614 RepID=A0A515DBB9_9BURK|nr:undecaprenyl-diphosphatase [Rhodoferax sediminis]QDL37680.1 undecaprenyl-diphosphatase [Rhodoferax sediminis]
MEEFNQSLFLLINAPAHPAPVLLAIAELFAGYVIWLVPLSLAALWLRGGEHIRKLMLEAALSGVVGLLIAQAIGLVWQHPRPFMIGLGHQLIPHVADSSFPSDHLTLLWSVAFGLLVHRESRAAGAPLALLGLPVAWARIYLGVHFPLDMVGAGLVAILSAGLCRREARWLVNPLLPWATAMHHRVFAPLIRHGWVAK